MYSEWISWNGYDDGDLQTNDDFLTWAPTDYFLRDALEAWTPVSGTGAAWSSRLVSDCDCD